MSALLSMHRRVHAQDTAKLLPRQEALLRGALVTTRSACPNLEPVPSVARKGVGSPGSQTRARPCPRGGEPNWQSRCPPDPFSTVRQHNGVSHIPSPPLHLVPSTDVCCDRLPEFCLVACGHTGIKPSSGDHHPADYPASIQVARLQPCCQHCLVPSASPRPHVHQKARVVT